MLICTYYILYTHICAPDILPSYVYHIYTCKEVLQLSLGLRRLLLCNSMSDKLEMVHAIIPALLFTERLNHLLVCLRAYYRIIRIFIVQW